MTRPVRAENADSGDALVVHAGNVEVNSAATGTGSTRERTGAFGDDLRARWNDGRAGGGSVLCRATD